jgi:hypothetical protein
MTNSGKNKTAALDFFACLEVTTDTLAAFGRFGMYEILLSIQQETM